MGDVILGNIDISKVNKLPEWKDSESCKRINK